MKKQKLSLTFQFTAILTIFKAEICISLTAILSLYVKAIEEYHEIYKGLENKLHMNFLNNFPRNGVHLNSVVSEKMYAQGRRSAKWFMLSRFSCVWLFATPWTVAHQAPLSMEFFRQEYWVGCHFLLHGIFSTQGSNPPPLCLLHWQVGSLPLVPPHRSTYKTVTSHKRLSLQEL